MWDRSSGATLAILGEHTNEVNGALAMADGRLLSWSTDDSLHLRDGRSGVSTTILAGHTHWVAGALELADGRLLS